MPPGKKRPCESLGHYGVMTWASLGHLWGGTQRADALRPSSMETSCRLMPSLYTLLHHLAGSPIALWFWRLPRSLPWDTRVAQVWLQLGPAGG